MVEQYPDSIAITNQPDFTQSAASGFYSETSGITTTYDCRAEVNGSGKTVAGRDGAAVDYSYVVYMPRTSDIIPFDADYSLTIGTLVITGQVKRASNGQLNSRLWV